VFYYGSVLSQKVPKHYVQNYFVHGSFIWQMFCPAVFLYKRVHVHPESHRLQLKLNPLPSQRDCSAFRTEVHVTSQFVTENTKRKDGTRPVSIFTVLNMNIIY
jgi:hypothetical protein